MPVISELTYLLNLTHGIQTLQHEDYKPYPVQPQAPPVNVASSLQTQPSDDYKNFDIVRAAQYGILDRCIELVDSGVDVNQPDAENVSVLHWAAINNRMEIVRYGSLLMLLPGCVQILESHGKSN